MPDRKVRISQVVEHAHFDVNSKEKDLQTRDDGCLLSQMMKKCWNREPPADDAPRRPGHARWRQSSSPSPDSDEQRSLTAIEKLQVLRRSGFEKDGSVRLKDNSRQERRRRRSTGGTNSSSTSKSTRAARGSAPRSRKSDSDISSSISSTPQIHEPRSAPSSSAQADKAESSSEQMLRRLGFDEQ